MQKRNVLIIVSNKKQAKKALKLLGESTAVIMALNLETEYFLKSQLKSYENPIYSILNKSSSLTQFKYIKDNFKAAYTWYVGLTSKPNEEQDENEIKEDDFYRYIRDRLGYFLVEFERSLYFAERAITKFKPKRIYGCVEDYKGSSVMQGTLKSSAFIILAKSKKIPFVQFKNISLRPTIRGLVGQILKQVRLLKKQTLGSECELLILANPRSLIMMSDLIKDLRNTFHIRILTYNITFDTKRKIDLLYPGYLEKERLLNTKLKVESMRIQRFVNQFKAWSKFSSSKYEERPQALKFIRKKIKRIIDEESSEIINDYLLAQKVMSDLKPKVLITTTDPDSKILPYVDKANQLGITTINIQHGAFFSVDPPINVPESQYFITWSKLTRLVLSRNKYFENVKMLQWQSPFHLLATRTNRHVKRANIRLLLLFAIDLVDINYKDYYYKALFDILSQAKLNLDILVRAHPVQNLSSLNALLANYGLIVRLDNNPDLHKSIKWADVVIFENTTAGLDSMLLGKPTIYFNPYTGNDLFGLSRYKAAMTVLNKKDLNKIVDFIKDYQKWPEYSKGGNRFAEEYLGLTAKRKPEEIVDILKKIISN